MLWQAKSQQILIVALLMLVALFSWGCWMYPLFTGASEIAVMPIILSMCWIGSMTFYGDAIRKRHLYFSERPISRTLVWWTRMFIPASAILVIVGVAWLSKGRLPYLQNVLVSVGVFGFAICSLVSMAATRPILGILGGPVLFVLIMVVQLTYLNDYADYFSWSWIAAIPVVFATWRLLPRWKRGHRGLGFDARVVAYMLLGMLCLLVAIYGYRIASIPAEMPQWRTAMLNDDVEAQSEDTSDATPFDHDKHMVERQEVLTQWRNTDAVYQAEYLAEYQKYQADLRKRLLVLASTARQAILDGELDSSFLFSQVEKDEETVLIDLSGSPRSMVSDVLQSVAPESLRRESREFAIKQAWRRYQEQSWLIGSQTDSYYTPKTIAGLSTGQSLLKYPWERLRADRFVDLAVKETLQYVQTPTFGADVIERLAWCWEAVYDRRNPAQAPMVPISLQSDSLLKQLRASVPAEG